MYTPGTLMKVVSKIDPVLMRHARSAGSASIKAEITGSQPAETSPKCSRTTKPLVYTEVWIEYFREQLTILKEAWTFLGNASGQPKAHTLGIAERLQLSTLNKSLQAFADLTIARHTTIRFPKLSFESRYSHGQGAPTTVQALVIVRGRLRCATQ